MNATHRPLAFPRVAVVTFSLVLCLLAAGCQTVSSLRDAQDTFNRAAAAENALRADLNRPLDGGGADTMIGLGAVRSGYASALLILNRITSESANKLRNDQLLGDALTLKALCVWRLGQFRTQSPPPNRRRAPRRTSFSRAIARCCGRCPA